MKLLLLGAVIATTLLAPGALAAPTKKEALPAPSLKLSLATGPGTWRIHLVNEGAVPVRIAADVRLVSLELTAPADGKKKPATVTCALPADARPSTDTGSDLVIPPTRSWSAPLDPLFYCFGAKERAALVAGTSVRARLGWTAKGPASGGPWVASPVGAGVGQVANARVVEAAPVTLDEAVTLPASSTAEPGADEQVFLTTAETLDVARGTEIGTGVTLVNDGDRAISLLYRPEMLLFRVLGPAGGVACGIPRQVPAPIRELYGSVGAHKKASLAVLVTSTCPAGTFDEPGLYRITPRLDLTGASARSVGLATWDGIASAKKPLVVRVRNPRRPQPLPKPALD